MNLLLCLALGLSGCAGPLRHAPPPPELQAPPNERPVAFVSSVLSVILREKDDTACDGPCADPPMRANIEGVCVRYASGAIACADVDDGAPSGDGLVLRRLVRRVFWRNSIDVAVRADLACALDPNGGVRCLNPKLGGAAVNVLTRPGARRVFLPDGRMVCAVDREGGLSCSHFPSEGRRSNAPLLVTRAFSRLGRVREPVPDSRCVIMTDARLACLNDLGDRADVVGNDVKYASVRSGKAELAGGCFVAKDGSVFCWGRNDVGEVGIGTRVPRGEPARVAQLSDAVEVSSSADHACARLEDGMVYCWGSPDGYAFGEDALRGAESFRVCDEKEVPNRDACVARRFPFQAQRVQAKPLRIGELSGAVSIAAGPQVTCGIRRDGQIVCVGGGHAGVWSLDFGAHP